MRRAAPLPHDLLGLGNTQAGLVSWGQCIDSGLTRPQLRRLVRVGEFVIVLRGVFEIPAAVPAMATVSRSLDHRRRRTAVLGLLPTAHGRWPPA
jgi:hypothetical protein